MAINNPYVPGDPYSYDLKWIVKHLKALLRRDGLKVEEITDLLDEDATTAYITSNMTKAIRIGNIIYFSFSEFRSVADHHYIKFNDKYKGSSAEYFPLYTRTAPSQPMDTILGQFRVIDGEIDLTDGGDTTYRALFSGSFVIGG